MQEFVKKCYILSAILFFVLSLNFVSFFTPVYATSPKELPELHFYYGNREWTYNSADYESVSYFYQSIGQKYGRWGDNIARSKLLRKVYSMGFDARDSLEYCFVGIDKILEDIDKSISRPYIDASYTFSKKSSSPFSFTREQEGFQVDFGQILESIASGLDKGYRVNIEILPNKLQPMIRYSDISHYSNLRSSFYTSFNGSIKNRKHNIIRASNSFNGLVMEQGQEFSFNKITGRRSEANGYLPANIIVDKKYVEGYGGGVCQVSTTLYNALILAGVEILEVHSHSLASNYVNLGFDAMVNYGTSDLRWVNNTDSKLFLRSYVLDNQIHFEIYGTHQPNRYKYKRITEIEKTIKPKADEVIIDEKGEYTSLVIFKDESVYSILPKNGYKVRAILEIYDNGKLIERKLIRRVTYQAVQGIKVVGTKERPKQVDKVEDNEIEPIDIGISIDKENLDFWKKFN